MESGAELRVQPAAFMEEGLWGLSAAQDLQAADVACSMPQTLIMSAQTAAESSLVSK